jgi:putative ABC transport system permease protein
VTNQLRLAWRTLRRRPILSLAIALTVGSALAATTIAFAVVRGVLLEPLPYADPDGLVALWETRPDQGNDRNVASPANFYAWRERLHSVGSVAALVSTSAALTGDGEPEQVGMMLASATYFPIVGATPLAGRFYSEREDVDGGPKVAVISEGLWRRRFGAAPGAVGRTIELNGTRYEIVGVLPARFDFAPRYAFASTGARDVWAPPQYDARARTWGGRFLQVIGRLAPGATVDQANQDVDRLASALRSEFPTRQEGWGMRAVELKTDQVGDVRPTVLIVFGAVLFVLLIACANVANLLLTRSAERQQEVAVRAALGAGRGAIFRQLLGESVVLTGLGGLAGLGLASWGVTALVASAPDLPRLDGVRLDGAVIGFGLLATLLASVLIGLGPAVQLAGQDLASWLTQRSTAGRRQAHRLRSVLVAAQVALSFVLLVGAGLLVRSLVNRLGVETGVSLDGLMTAEVSLPGLRYGGPERRSAFFEQLVDRVTASPGVASASIASIVPMSGDGQATSFRALDLPAPAPGQEPVADVRFVQHDYHRTMGIDLLEGHPLDGSGVAGGPISVLINQAGANLLWPGQSAIGKQIEMVWGDTLVAEVVGVVRDVRLAGPDRPARTTLYWDYRQVGVPTRMVVIARAAAGRPEALAPVIRAAVHDLDPNLPVYNVRTMLSYFGDAVARARFTTVALGLFALLALALAVLGIYGVMAYAIRQREREIGIRLALGADRGTVVGMVLREGTRVVLPALVVGAGGALALTRLLQSLVFEVSPADPATFGAVGLLLGLAALAACWLPARRASGIDPVEAMRTD